MANETNISGQKPSYLILGGCGFIGRNLIEYLVTNNLASTIRIVDKVPPQVAWLNSRHEKVFSDPIVEFKSANLINMPSCEIVFSPGGWDYVVNCACETKPGQTDPVYQEGILKLSINCATQAAQQNVKHYIELSSGNMYSSEKIQHKEDGPIEPWTFVAKWKIRVENEIKTIPGLRYTILRLPRVYGVGDRNGLTPRILFAAIYKQLNETMKMLWTENLKLNTIHVIDVCRAIIHVCGRDDTLGKVYNVVDSANSTQGSITEILADIFNIEYDYLGSIMSTIAKADMGNIVNEINDKHLLPWAEACRKDNIENTPLSPYMSLENLYDRHLNLDGQALLSTGFTLSIPKPTKDLLKEIIDDYVEMKVFPSSLIL